MTLITAYKWSINEWHNLVESGVLAGKSVELLDGEIARVSPEKPIHSSRIVRVADYLRNLLGDGAQVREAHSVTLDQSEPEPDIAVVSYRSNFYSDRHPHPIDIYWLIEVSSSTLALDTKIKSKIYARNGIKEYWIIDLVNSKLIVYTQPLGEQYTKVVELDSGSVSPQAFPDLDIQLNRFINFG